MDESPIDTSLQYYMEERALAIALAMASTPERQVAIDRLVALRATLMKHRQAHAKKVLARRHASSAAIDALSPPREEMDANVRTLYMEQETSEDVLRAHARIHFASARVSKRLDLAALSADIAESIREMQLREESFARAWIDAIGDPSGEFQTSCAKSL